MAILEKTVFVTLNGSLVKHLENLGYEIPRIRDKWHNGKFTIPKGTKIEVKVDDLPEGSHTLLHKICDYCEVLVEKPQEYREILKAREIDGKDCCKNCVGSLISERKSNKPIPKKKSLAFIAPHLISEWHPTLNKKSPYEVSYGNDDKFWWLCPDCESQYEASPNNRTNTKVKNNCPYCAGQKINHTNCLAITHPHIAKEWNFNKNKEITPNDVSMGSNKKFWWICSECTHEWFVSPNARTNGETGCPKCNESKGEKVIGQILDKLGLKYIRQYKDKKCKNIKPLPFDFAVFKNKQILCLIEYDGEQHFKPFKRRFGKERSIIEFNKIQKNDQIKTDFCLQNNIKLIRISYTEFDRIGEIINIELNKIISHNIS